MESWHSKLDKGKFARNKVDISDIEVVNGGKSKCDKGKFERGKLTEISFIETNWTGR